MELMNVDLKCTLFVHHIVINWKRIGLIMVNSVGSCMMRSTLGKLVVWHHDNIHHHAGQQCATQVTLTLEFFEPLTMFRSFPILVINGVSNESYRECESKELISLGFLMPKVEEGKHTKFELMYAHTHSLINGLIKEKWMHYRLPGTVLVTNRILSCYD